MYANNNFEEVTSYKYLIIDLRHKINWRYSIEKGINGGWKAYHGFENSCKSKKNWLWDMNKLFFEALVTHVSLYSCEFQDCNISRET